ncbi:MAG TPA: DNA-processing protein DprA [Acidimicrobiales bacterium]|nr:DNA-processing protein DprA [Acidimicrobiales bacterium]
MKPADVGFATAIASLPKVGPARLRMLLDAGEPEGVWERLCCGTLGDDAEVVASLGPRADTLLAGWRGAARTMDPGQLAVRHAALGFRLLDAEDPDYPSAFRDDAEPPRLLWVAGDLGRILPRVVAIVGSRRCTRYGHDVARRFGRELALAGVSVVSGLALGIDAAAHAGALDAPAGAAPPVGVVGTGLDVIYPRRNRALWQAVAERGVLLSESPPGASAEPWRFPARNRLIAALADIVVVVESTERGGSLYTVDEAMARDVEVRAVPGPITAPTSAGTNRLLADGAAPALNESDLLESLGVVAATPIGEYSTGYRDPEEEAVLDVLTTGSVTFDELAERSGLSLERLGLVTARLQVEGLLSRSGGWYERAG